MKILVAGDWHSDLHEDALKKAMEKNGHDAVAFGWHHYFAPTRSQPLRMVETVAKKFQNKYLTGSILRRLNRDLFQRVRQTAPDAVFIYRGTHILRTTLEAIRAMRPETVLLGYNNDDAFSDNYPAYIWRHFIDAIPGYDAVLAYRHKNLDDFKRAGARRVGLLRSWYIPERNHPVVLTRAERERYGCEVVFAGHYEADGRKEMLEALVREGIDLKLYGPGFIHWDRVLARSAELRRFLPLRFVWGGEYNKALNGAKIALCFLSKLNRDTYTRRCFEIPATGALMLAEYSEDLADMFKPGVEADYFRSTAELIDKVKRYLADDALRRRVADAGRRRVAADGHDIYSRAEQIVDLAQNIRAASACGAPAPAK